MLDHVHHWCKLATNRARLICTYGKSCPMIRAEEK